MENKVNGLVRVSPKKIISQESHYKIEKVYSFACTLSPVEKAGLISKLLGSPQKPLSIPVDYCDIQTTVVHQIDRMSTEEISEILEVIASKVRSETL